MRIIGTTLLLAVCCGFSPAQSSAVQQTENQRLPESRRTVLDVAQMQIAITEAVKQQNDGASLNDNRLRALGIERVPETRLVIKDGAVYLMLTNDRLLPMSGGGASACVPENPKNVGGLISLPPENQVNPAPAKDPAKKN
jgi:hypothetical protein